MATAEWGDSFSHYVKNAATSFSASPMSKKWTGQVGGDDANQWVVQPEYALPGAQGGCGLAVSSSNGRHLYKTLPGGSQATRCVSIWWYTGSATASQGAIIAFLDAGSEQVSVRTDSSSRPTITRAGTVLATSTNVLSSGTWYHLQFKATIHNTTGVVELRVNGTSTGWIASTSALNTRSTANNSASQIQVGNLSTTHRFAHVLVADDFTGMAVGAWRPGVAAGNYQQWTPNSGDNHGAVASPYTDDDASFNASTTSGNKDTFLVDDIPSGGSPTILGVQHVIYVKQDAGIARTVRPKTRISSTDYNGSSVAVGASYAYVVEMAAVSPATATAWTKAEFDGAEFGYENV